MNFETSAIHEGEEPNLKEGGYGDVVSPIHISSTFARFRASEPTGGYEYSRSGNPTRNALERKLASLEGAKHGLAFSSGLAAETVVLLSLLKRGDHVVACDDLYGGTRMLFDSVAVKFGISFTYVDTSNVSTMESALTDDTRLVWLESPTNPTLKLSDIQGISERVRDKGVKVVVDNTFMSPVFQSPLLLGADLVLHSTTKYINGHSDSVGGAIMTSDDSLYEKLKFHQNAVGAVLSPFDSFLVMRGIKTLAIRMKQHENNAFEIASFLESHPKVERVIYPGLDSHPQHHLAKLQMAGFGGVVSVELKGDAEKFVTSLKLFALAESLGGVESLVEIPSRMTHEGVPKEDREKLGISDSLVRLSVGIEDCEDLLEDIDRALNDC